MSRVKKMLRASLAGLTLFVVVLAVVALVAPRLIGLRHLRDRITAELSQRLSATVRCDALGLSLLPLPAVVLRGVHVSIPGRIDTHIGSVSVSPRFLSLLRGKFQLREVRIESPEISVQRLPPATARKESPAGLAATVESALGDASLVAFSAAAGAAVVVHAGTLTFPLGEGGMLQLRRIDAQFRLPPALMSIDAQCTSNVWERLSLHASIDPISTDLSGQMEVAQLRPQLIAVDVLPAGMRLGDSEANLKLAVSTRNPLQALHAAVEGSIPALTVDRGHDQVVLRSKRLDATCETEGDALHATLAQLELDYPHLQLSGSLSVATDRVAVDLQATDVDVDSARQAATLVAGDVPIVRSILNVLRGGTVPQITERRLS